MTRHTTCLSSSDVLFTVVSRLRPVRVNTCMRILVTDAHVDTADTLATLLQLWGHEVRVAYDGESALLLARQFQPHIAVLDVPSRAATSHDLAAKLRNQVERVRIIATGSADFENGLTSDVEDQFDAFLRKPCDLQALESLLADYFLRDTQ